MTVRYAPGDNDPSAGATLPEIVAAYRVRLMRSGVDAVSASATAKRQAAEYMDRELSRLLTERRALEVSAYGQISEPTSATITNH